MRDHNLKERIAAIVLTVLMIGFNLPQYTVFAEDRAPAAPASGSAAVQEETASDTETPAAEPGSGTDEVTPDEAAPDEVTPAEVTPEEETVPEGDAVEEEGRAEETAPSDAEKPAKTKSKEAEVKAEGDPVARIGDTEYASIADAVAAAADGDTVTLLQDAVLDSTLDVGAKSITIDLGAYSITPGFTTSSSHPLMMFTGDWHQGDKPVTIKGSGGRIETAGTHALKLDCAYVILETGITVKASSRAIDMGGSMNYSSSGTHMYIRGATVTAGSDTIYSYSTSTEEVYIESGTVIAEDGYAYYTYGGYLKVTGGEINSGSNGPVMRVDDLNNNIHIRGGSFNQSVDDQYIDEGFVQYADGHVAPYEIRLTVDPASGHFTNLAHDPAKQVLLPDDSDVADQAAFVWTNADGEEVTAPKEVGAYTLTATYGEYSDEATYTVTQSIARIGDTYYPSLADAFAAASDGNTIELIDDAAISADIAIETNVTLDLAGHTVDAPADFQISSGTFTLKDSSSDGTGKIVFSHYGEVFVGETTAGFIMEGGTLDGTVPNTLRIEAGTATVNGGLIKSSSAAYGPVSMVGNSSESELTINGGTIQNPEGEAVMVSGSKANLTVTGGTIEGKYGVVVYNGAQGTISGGTIIGSHDGVVTTGDTWSQGRLLIQGGTITGGTYGANASRGSITVMGNTQGGEDPVIIGSGSGKSVAAGSSATFTINGGFFSDDEGNGDAFTRPQAKRLLESTTMAGYYELIDAAAIIAETGVIYPTLEAARDATTSENKTVQLISDIDVGTFSTGGKTFTLDLNGYTLHGSSWGAVSVSVGSVVTIKDSSEDESGRIECRNIDAAAAVSVQGVLILESGTIEYYGNGTGSGISFLQNQSPYYSRTGVIINGGTVIGKESGVEFYYGSGEFTINGGIIKGDTSLVNTTGQKVTINGGYFSDDAGNDRDLFNRPAGQKLGLVGGTGELADYYALRPLVATIGSEEYFSLAEAVAAAADGDTIVMTSDSTEDAAAININKRVTLDLAGHTVTTAGTITTIQPVTVTDSSDEKDGVIDFTAGDYGLTVTGSSAFTLDAGTIHASSNSAVRLANNSTININEGGKVVCDGDGPAIYNNGTSDPRVYVYGTVQSRGDAIVLGAEGIINVVPGGSVTSQTGTALTVQGTSTRIVISADSSGKDPAVISGVTGIRTTSTSTGPVYVRGGIITGTETSLVKEGSGRFEITGGLFSDDAGNADAFTRPDNQFLTDLDGDGYYELVEVDKTALQEAVDSAIDPEDVKVSEDGKDVSDGQYWATGADKAAYVEALANAEQVLADAKATQKQVNDALAALNAAKETIHQAAVDKSNLQALVDAVPDPANVQESADGHDVTEGAQWATPDDKAAYVTALNDANRILADPNATQGEVDAATLALGTAAAKIQAAEVDKSALQEALADAILPTDIQKSADGKDVPNGNYWATETDWNAYTEAFNQAVAELVNTDSQQDVDNALAALLEAAEKIKTASADKTVLQAAVDAAIDPADIVGSADGKDVPDGSKWAASADKAAYEEALTNANTVLAKTDATQNEVDAALEALNDAAEKNKTASVDRTALQAAVNSATDPADIAASADGKDVPDGDKWATSADKAAYEEALANANTVFDKEHPTQNEVDAALAALTEAAGKIKTASTDKSALAEAVDNATDPADIAASANGKDVPDGDKWATSADKAAYEEALTNANTVLGKEHPTQNEVDAALTALTRAARKIKTASTDKSALEEAFDDATDPGDVAAGTDCDAAPAGGKWAEEADKAAYEEAYEAAEAALNNSKATQNEVDAAKEALAEAASKLKTGGHEWSEWTVTKKATVSEEGLKVRTCSKCGKTEEATIPMTKMGTVTGMQTQVDPSKKTVKVTFKAVAGATDYEISYRLAGATKWTTKKSGGKTMYTITGLGSKKLYDIRVRGYRKGDGAYTAWTSVSHRYIGGLTKRKLTAPKSGQLKVVWSKDSNATGYIISYSTKHNMSGAKNITVVGGNKTSRVIKGLKKGTTYYVKIRSYKTKNGVKYTGAKKYTVPQSVKIK